MDRKHQIINASFSRETSFPLAISESPAPPERADETRMPRYRTPPGETGSTKSGIPESPLHD